MIGLADPPCPEPGALCVVAGDDVVDVVEPDGANALGRVGDGREGDAAGAEHHPRVLVAAVAQAARREVARAGITQGLFRGVVDERHRGLLARVEADAGAAPNLARDGARRET